MGQAGHAEGSLAVDEKIEPSRIDPLHPVGATAQLDASWGLLEPSYQASSMERQADYTDLPDGAVLGQTYAQGW